MTEHHRIETLHARHSHVLMRFLVALTHGDRATAEDLTQETLLRAWRHIDDLPDTAEGERRWLLTVGRRLVIDTVRGKESRPKEVAGVDLDRVATGDDTPDAAIAVHSVVGAYRKLTPNHRAVLAQLYLQGLPIEEVAGRMRVPVGTVRS